MKMLLPWNWLAGMKGGYALMKADPVGGAFLWFASGVQTFLTTTLPAWLASYLHPRWMQELVSEAPTFWRETTEVIGEATKFAWQLLNLH